MTDQAIAPPRGAKFSIGNVLSTSFTLLWSNRLKFFIAPAVVVGAALGLSTFLIAAEARALIQGRISAGMFLLIMLAAALLLIIASSLTTAVTVNAAFQALRGERVRLGASFRRGLAAVVPVSIASIIVGLCIMLGLVLLILPGLFVMAAFCLFVPAIVVEGKGINTGINRSMALTRGHMWGVFAILVVVLASNLLLNYLDTHVIRSLAGPLISGICTFIITVVFDAYNSIAVTVGYYFLRADKEGVDIDNIAKVFD